MILRKCLPLYRIFKPQISNKIITEKPCRSRALFVQFSRLVHQLNGEDISNVSIAEIKRTLKTNFGGFLEGHTCFVIDCPICRKLKNGGIEHGKLYINSRTGYTLCTHCLSHGSWQNLESYVAALQTTASKNAKPTKEGNILNKHELPASDQAVIKRYLEAGKPIEHVGEQDLLSLLAELDLTFASTKTLQKYGALVNLPEKQLIFPVRLSSSSPVVALKVLSPRQNAQSSETEEPSTPTRQPLEINVPADSQWMFGLQHVKNKEEVIITSTAADVLAVAQNLTVPAVCAPTGIEKLPQTALPFLEQFRKITLWLDNGIQGWEAAKMFSKKLNERRCFFVRPSTSSPSPSLAVQDNLSLLPILKSSLPMAHKSITTFSSLRDEVYAELTQSSTVAGVRWKRFPILTELLKGHRRGELTVFTGPTGAGKTTFISEYSLDLCMQKVSTLWGSFEIRNVRLAKMMLQQFAGLPLEQNIGMFQSIANDFEKLPLYFLLFHGQQQLKNVLEAMSHAVYVHDIAHVLVDNLQFMMGTGAADSTSSDRFWKQDQIIGAFRQFATLNNVHVTLVIHPRKEDAEELSTSSIFGSAKASQEADNVLILQDKRLTDPSSRRKYIQVTKNRYSGDLGIMPLEFHKDSLSFAQRKRPTRSSKKTQQSADE